jgi:hypothetical protein
MTISNYGSYHSHNKPIQITRTAVALFQHIHGGAVLINHGLTMSKDFVDMLNRVDKRQLLHFASDQFVLRLCHKSLNVRFRMITDGSKQLACSTR